MYFLGGDFVYLWLCCWVVVYLTSVLWFEARCLVFEGWLECSCVCKLWW